MKYQIKKMKQFEMSGGVALTADLYRDGKLIAFLEDKGDGGGLAVRWAEGHVWTNPEEAKHIADFYAEHAGKKHWTQEHVGSDYSNDVELQVEWLIEMHQSKQLAKVGY
jgi:hypothetical protein